MTVLKRVATASAGALAAIASGTAMGDCGPSSCNSVYIDELYLNATPNGPLYVRTSGNEALTNCTPLSGVFLVLNDSSRFKEVYALLLSAQLSDKRVNIRFIDGSTPCTIAYVTMARGS